MIQPWKNVQHLTRRALNSPTLVNTFWVGAGTVANGLLGTVSSVLYARALGVNDFGILTLIISFITMMAALTDLGIGGSIVKFGAESVARGELETLRGVSAVALRGKLLLILFVLGLVLLFLNPLLSYIFKHVDARITTYFFLSLIAIVFGALSGFLAPVYQVFKQFRRQSVISVIPIASKLILIILAILALSRLTITLAIWIEIVAAALLVVLLYISSPFKAFTLRVSDSGLQRRMFSFNKWLSVYFILTIIGGRLDLFIVGGLSDGHALGIYGTATKIASLVIVINNSYLTVMLPDFSSSISQDDLKRRQRNSWAIVTLIVCGIGFLALIAEPLVLLLFGGDFADVAPVLQIMCIGLASIVLAYPVNATLFALNRSFVFTITAAVSTLTLIVGNIWLIPQFGVTGAAATFASANLLALLTSILFYMFAGRKAVLQLPQS